MSPDPTPAWAAMGTPRTLGFLRGSGADDHPFVRRTASVDRQLSAEDGVSSVTSEAIRYLRADICEQIVLSGLRPNPAHEAWQAKLVRNP